MGDLNKALAHAVLAGTSAWSLIECKDLLYARVAFGLYLTNGVIGVVDYVIPRSNHNVKRLLHALARWSRPLYIPLIAAEAFKYAGFEDKWCYCHLIFPTCYLVLTELLKKNIKTELLDLSTICNSISICYSAYIKEDMFGALCALINLATFMGPTFDSLDYLLMIGAANIAAVQFFKQVFFG